MSSRAQLLALAESQEAEIEDPAVRDCWYVLREAISNGWLVPEGPGSLRELIEELEQGGGLGAEEYSIDVDPEDDRYVLAGFVQLNHRCLREPFLGELRRLESRRRLSPPAAGSAPPPTTDIPDPESIRRLFQLLAGAESSELPRADEGERVRREAHEELARLAEHPDALGSDEMRQALTGLTDDDRARMADALRTFAAWAEQPNREGGAAVDDAIRALERTLGWLAQGQRAEAKATDERIKGSARDAIARRLGGTSDA